MKRTGIVYLILMLVCLCGTPCMAQNDKESASVHYIMAAGQSAGGESQAAAQAEKKAVTQALARMITPDMDRESIFSQVTARYADYVAGKCSIVKVQQQKGNTIVFCQVPVDFARLQQDLQHRIRSQQEDKTHHYDETSFFVRVTGLTQPRAKQEEQAQVLQCYTDAFQQYGFYKSAADELLVNYMTQYDSLPYRAYAAAMTEHIKMDVSISLAVIGEIHLEPSVTDDEGTTSTCTSHIMVVYADQDGQLQPIGSFTDTYTLRRTNKEEAEHLVLQKAAYNSAKYLSHVTLNFWQTKK